MQTVLALTSSFSCRKTSEWASPNVLFWFDIRVFGLVSVVVASLLVAIASANISSINANGPVARMEELPKEGNVSYHFQMLGGTPIPSKRCRVSEKDLMC